jgi:hypothetical protein
MRVKTLLRQFTVWVVLLTLTTMNASCTKEKAEAIKGGAEQFRVEATSALEKTRDIVKESVAVVQESKDDEVRRIVDQLENPSNGEKRTNAQVIRFAQNVLSTGDESIGTTQKIDKEFETLVSEYDLFASMFRSLPRGHFFAKEAVAKAERHAIRLTARFIKIASELQTNPIQFTGRRGDLITKLILAGQIEDKTARTQAQTLLAQQLIQLREDEQKARDAAILQCLRAAEAGKAVTELIRNYKKFTIGDMLTLVNESLGLVNAITAGTNKDIKGLVTRYNAFVTNKIQTDELWRDVLNNDLGWSPGNE